MSTIEIEIRCARGYRRVLYVGLSGLRDKTIPFNFFLNIYSGCPGLVTILKPQ